MAQEQASYDTSYDTHATRHVRSMYLNEKHIRILGMLDSGLCQKEVSEHLGKSIQTVGCCIEVLRRHGYVARQGRKRNLKFRLTEQGTNMLGRDSRINHVQNSIRYGQKAGEALMAHSGTEQAEPARREVAPIATVPRAAQVWPSTAVVIGSGVIGGIGGFSAGYAFGFNKGVEYQIKKQQEEDRKKEGAWPPIAMH